MWKFHREINSQNKNIKLKIWGGGDNGGIDDFKIKIKIKIGGVNNSTKIKIKIEGVSNSTKIKDWGWQSFFFFFLHI